VKSTSGYRGVRRRLSGNEVCCCICSQLLWHSATPVDSVVIVAAYWGIAAMLQVVTAAPSCASLGRRCPGMFKRSIPGRRDRGSVACSWRRPFTSNGSAGGAGMLGSPPRASLFFGGSVQFFARSFTMLCGKSPARDGCSLTRHLKRWVK